MWVRRGLLFASMALLPGAVPSDAPKEAAEYTLTETRKTLTPRGEVVSSVSGRVLAASGRAVWDLGSGRFPGCPVSAVIAEGAQATFLDRREKLFAQAGWADFEGLFRPAPATDPGLSSASVHDLSVSVAKAGGGVAFEGRPTLRYVLSASYRMAVTIPGRIGNVNHRLRATIDLAEGSEVVGSPFDSLSRLFNLRGKVLEGVEAELGKLEGFPVFARVEASAVYSFESAGMARDPSEAGVLPMKTSSTAVREVSSFSRRRVRPEDSARLDVPGEYHSRAPERLLEQSEGLAR